MSSGGKKRKTGLPAGSSSGEESGSGTPRVGGIFRRLTSALRSGGSSASPSPRSSNPPLSTDLESTPSGRSQSKWTPSLLGACLRGYDEDIQDPGPRWEDLPIVPIDSVAPPLEQSVRTEEDSFQTEIVPGDILQIGTGRGSQQTRVRITAGGGGHGSPGGGQHSPGPGDRPSTRRGDAQAAPTTGGGQGSHGGSLQQSSPTRSRGGNSPSDRAGGQGGGGGSGRGDGDPDDVDGDESDRDDERGDEYDEEEREGEDAEPDVGNEEAYLQALCLLPDEPSMEMGPVLLEQAVGLDAEAYEESLLAGRYGDSRRLTRWEINDVRMRNERLTRPVLDPSNPLVNYGHRRWPIDNTDDTYVIKIMRCIWPGGLGMFKKTRERATMPWRNDASYNPRLNRLIEEFNTCGLPRTVHASLAHESQNPPNEKAINPSYRCDCWPRDLGENWYNETDASILKKLGPAWVIDGQPLLIHLLTKLVTVMTQDYMANSFRTFKQHNPGLSKPHVLKYGDEISALFDKMMETRGYRSARNTSGKNDCLRDQDKRLLAQLCGISKHQVSRKLQGFRYAAAGPGASTQRAVGASALAPRAAKPFSFDLAEMLYMDKFLLRRKLFNPNYFPSDLPHEYFEGFKEIAKPASLEDESTINERMLRYAKRFLRPYKLEDARRGVKIRTEAVSYYNLLAPQRGLPDYNVFDSRSNNPELLEMVATHMETVLTQRHKEMIEGMSSLTDYEARDIAAINQAAAGLEDLDATPDTTRQENAGQSSAERPATQNLAGGTSGSAPGTGSAAGGRVSPARAGRERVAQGIASEPGTLRSADHEFMRTNFGRGSVQERIQPILLDLATGPDSHLTSNRMRRLLEIRATRRAARERSAPAPNQAFPDIYDQLFQEHLSRARKRRMDGRPLRGPSGPLSPAGGGGDGDDGLPPSPPRVTHAERMDRYRQFHADVTLHFPDILELIKPPTLAQLFYQDIESRYPGMQPYIHLPRHYWAS